MAGILLRHVCKVVHICIHVIFWLSHCHCDLFHQMGCLECGHPISVSLKLYVFSFSFILPSVLPVSAEVSRITDRFSTFLALDSADDSSLACHSFRLLRPCKTLWCTSCGAGPAEPHSEDAQYFSVQSGSFMNGSLWFLHPHNWDEEWYVFYCPTWFVVVTFSQIWSVHVLSLLKLLENLIQFQKFIGNNANNLRTEPIRHLKFQSVNLYCTHRQIGNSTWSYLF